MKEFRKAAVAGLFYPSDPKKLNEEIYSLLSISQTEKIFPDITGIISPHAGYIYSGRTAAYAYNLLRGKNFSNVIIISPSHREYFPGTCIFSGDGYQTPLGTAEINKEMSDNIIAGSKTIFKGTQGHGQEHAVEVQIPFLQSVLSGFQIIPVVMGDQSKIFVDELAEQIAKVLDNDTIIIASSDMSHYYTKQKADELDSIVEKAVNDFGYEKLQDYFERRICEACGGGPIVAMMKAASHINRKNSFVLHRSDSGDVTRDFNEVVGYLSAVIYGE